MSFIIKDTSGKVPCYLTDNTRVWDAPEWHTNIKEAHQFATLAEATKHRDKLLKADEDGPLEIVDLDKPAKKAKVLGK
jgi:hypothetical protein